ncbi:hypothetical protein Q7689_15055, partial [Nocardiopsis tropica]|nr:hypothetical protein [Nocardiopsis tropica]
MPRRLVTRTAARWGARLGPLVLSGAVLLCAAAPTAAAEPRTPAASASAEVPRAGGGPDLTDRRGGPVVLVGVPGLLWQDVTPEHTPTLWGMAEEGAIGNVSIRSATSRT